MKKYLMYLLLAGSVVPGMVQAQRTRAACMVCKRICDNLAE